MKYILLIISSLLFSVCSFSQGKSNLDYTNSDKLALELIQICVDLTLKLDQGLNTGRYLIDFNTTNKFNKLGVETFLKLNANATVTNLDSLVLHDSSWIKYQFFQNTVIRFDKIEILKDGTILVNTSKTKSSDGAIGTEILLQKQGDDFKCISSKITWIS